MSSSETLSSKSDSFASSSDASEAEASPPAAPESPRALLLIFSSVDCAPGWSFARSAFLEFSFASSLASAFALLVLLNLLQSGFCSSGT